MLNLRHSKFKKQSILLAITSQADGRISELPQGRYKSQDKLKKSVLFYSYLHVSVTVAT